MKEVYEAWSRLKALITTHLSPSALMDVEQVEAHLKSGVEAAVKQAASEAVQDVVKEELTPAAPVKSTK